MMSSGPKQLVVWAPLIFFFLFRLLFVLLSHRYSCHHHDHGRHVGTEGKDDEQWAQTACRLGPLDMFVFFLFCLLFFLLSHNIYVSTTSMNDTMRRWRGKMMSSGPKQHKG